MVAYEFYLLDPKGGYQIIGLLPERRKDPTRITQESIMRWGENILGNDFDFKDIFFIQVTIDEKTVRIYRPVPFTITKTVKGPIRESDARGAPLDEPRWKPSWRVRNILRKRI